jgi:molybdopterin-containing oxidoreductase family iron-sulfur binding subunit
LVVDTRKLQSEEDLEPMIEICDKIHNVPKFENKNHEIKWIWGEEFKHVFPMQEQDFLGYRLKHMSFLTLCNHCGEAPCVRVCPTKATFKREDNIVLIDNNRCIGCKFCITSCPYSARQFNWSHKDKFKEDDTPYSPETGVPGQEGTVIKCDFCPDLLRQGKLPYCASSCPMGVIYFGDKNEDLVTNGEETVRFSELINDRGGYRHLEHLGTKPNVYYLPAVNRQFPLERGFDVEEEVIERYKEVPYVQEMKKKGKI